MTRKIIYIALISLLAACDRFEATNDYHIGLKAGVGEIGTVSKSTAIADPYEGTTPTSGKPLAAEVWFSRSATSFPDSIEDDATNLPSHTTMTFNSEAATYAYFDKNGNKSSEPGEEIKYPTDATNVYCVGFHPVTDKVHPTDGWSTTDGFHVSHPINGSEDLMFADVISGTWDSHFQPQEYKHLLTWIKVNVCAMTMETAKQWGKVTKITISSKSSVNIDLSKAKGHSEKITYGGDDQTLVIYDDPTGTDLSLTSQVLGSVFCSPMTISVPVVGNDGQQTGENKTLAGYTVSITTKPEGSTEITTTIKVGLSDLDYNDVRDPGSTVGKLYILSLYFNPFNIIEGTCTLNYWNGQNDDLYLTPPAQS